MISGTCVILPYCTLALLSNSLSSVDWSALGSELSQNFADLAIFLSRPIHREPQSLESDIQMAGLYPPQHVSVNGDHTSPCPLHWSLPWQLMSPFPDGTQHWVQCKDPCSPQANFQMVLIWIWGVGEAGTSPTTKNKQGALASFSSSLPPPCTGTPNSAVSTVRDGTNSSPA